eukprot:544714_1
MKVTKLNGLQTEDMFVRKVTELAEYLMYDIVFVIGKNGAGKSQVWKMLCAAYNELGEKTVYEAFNPKSVKNDELYGWLSAYNELGEKTVYEAFNPKSVKNDELYGWLSAYNELGE